MKKIKIFNVIITILFALITYYFTLPPLNPQSFEFWTFITMITALFCFLQIMTNTSSLIVSRKIPKYPKWITYCTLTFLGIFLIIGLMNFAISPLLNAKGYASRIKIDETTDFNKDIEPVNFQNIPLLDKDSSQKLGDRVMGQMPELVSQFVVSDLYTQINYNNEIVRVTPLEYNGIFKYFANAKTGVKGYIMVNSVTGESKLIKLDKGMKYMPSSYFFTNLHRHLRLKYPTTIFGQESFEIDNEGNPYWIIPTIKYSGVGMKKEISGVVILDPITGKSKKYSSKDIPTWVDHVYSADLIIAQVNDWGKYKNGFFNSIFGQKNVVATTSGYNYTVMNDDVYLYTGITSAAKDQAILGFILTNMRTKETHFYTVPGAEEYSAMASAEGQIQQMNYRATFPLLINLNGKATYLISLKDNAGLVKMYAFVDVVDYQKVVVTDAVKGIETAAENYLGEALNQNEQQLTKQITVKNIKEAIIKGTTYYYLTDTENNKYRVSITVEEEILPFLSPNQKVEIHYSQEKNVTEIQKLKLPEQ